MKVSEYFPLVMVSLRKHLCCQRLSSLKSRKTLNLHFWSKIAGEIAKIFWVKVLVEERGEIMDSSSLLSVCGAMEYIILA
jgi:hypothetical protein